MSSTVQKSKNAITLKGSAKLVCDYLNYGINSILFQRGIYPSESFKSEEHFGLSILVSTDEKINEFLVAVLGQIKDWLVQGKLEKLSLIITNVTNKEVMERWDFKLQYEATKEKCEENGEPIGTKELKVIQNEIRDVLRQICSTVSFLPLLDCPCKHPILVMDSQVKNPEQIKQLEEAISLADDFQGLEQAVILALVTLSGSRYPALGYLRGVKYFFNDYRKALRLSALPTLHDAFFILTGAFDLLIYTKPDIEVPDQWGETGPCFIANSEELQLRSFSTSLHRMDTVVSYKVE